MSQIIKEMYLQLVWKDENGKEHKVMTPRWMELPGCSLDIKALIMVGAYDLLSEIAAKSKLLPYAVSVPEAAISNADAHATARYRIATDRPGSSASMCLIVTDANETVASGTNLPAIKKLVAKANEAPPPVTDAMVTRFLNWRLPEDFAPDCGITFVKNNHPTSWPIGTNLLTAIQARAMLEHVLKQTP